jgi:hypothetical protein
MHNAITHDHRLLHQIVHCDHGIPTSAYDTDGPQHTHNAITYDHRLLHHIVHCDQVIPTSEYDTEGVMVLSIMGLALLIEIN